MSRTSRVLVAMGAVTLMAYGSALAQAPGDKPPAAPPGAASPAPGGGPADQAGAAAQTATGELVSVDAKANTLSVKTSSGEVTIKYDDSTKVSGASKTTAGLATMQGSQVTVRYRKDGASNMATSIDIKPAAGAAPGGGLGGDRPSPGGGDRPSPPGGDPSKPPTPRP
jgi:hypothetical protein